MDIEVDSLELDDVFQRLFSRCAASTAADGDGDGQAKLG
jgi:hypothetical protein